MMDKEKALQIIWDRCQHSKETEKALEVLQEERPHGEWKRGQGSYGFPVHECSKCGFHGNQLWHFCPSCGASMRVKYELNRVSKELNSEIEKSKSEIVPDYRDGWRLREGEQNEI